ncbi:helix-turn-helix transcriptional regulator [Halorubrum distributum]|uniref:helix-turn-helix transcriptional regulator n=1 Tax=Halorubrum distributum TaxID=29283 RepID=UPI002953B7C9|nr:helix-turn-helix transcriptional regulator [Halorubrum distributum]MDV7351274.1 helix-turn-helix transcriptional regulator [Halorubrum distributum]
MENNLKVWRAKADVTQAELAEAVEVSRQTINAIERGRYDPSLELAFALANFFECTIEDIFHPDTMPVKND